MRQTIYQQILGASYSNLPQTLRTLHGLQGHAAYTGRADIQRGANPLAQLCAAIAGLPPGMRDAPTRVEFTADHDRELWQRNFGGSRMSSQLTCRDGLLCEMLGPIQFHFELRTEERVIWWKVKKVKLLGLFPLPAQLFHGVKCREREMHGRYEFLVEAVLPVIGPLIRYEGWLEPA